MTEPAAGGEGRTRPVPQDRCIALSGKGAPGAAALEEAIEALAATAAELRVIKRRGGHEFKPPEPEIRMRTPPPGARGGSGWTVLVRVPPFVTARDVRAAVTAVARRHAVAMDVRLSPLDTSAPARGDSRPGRDRMPGKIRETRNAPQHRAREVRGRAARAST